MGAVMPEEKAISFAYDDDERELVDAYHVRSWTIPAGFRWNGASIPKVAWSIIGSPFTGRYQRAALLHDFLYEFQGWPPAGCGPRVHSRKAVDVLFYRMMREDGVGWWRAKIMYSAVRVGGGRAWAS